MKTNKTPSSIQLCGDIGVLATNHTPPPEPVVMSGAVQIWSELRQRTLLYNIKVVKLQHNKISLQFYCIVRTATTQSGLLVITYVYHYRQVGEDGNSNCHI